MSEPKSDTTRARLQEFVKDLNNIADEFDKRVATEDAMLSRLTFILGDDAGLAKTVYDYVVLGHLSHHSYLRSRLAWSAENV